MANTQKLCDKRYNYDVTDVSAAQNPNSKNMLNVMFYFNDPQTHPKVLFSTTD